MVNLKVSAAPVVIVERRETVALAGWQTERVAAVVGPGVLDEEDKAAMFPKTHYTVMLKDSLLYTLLIDSDMTVL